MALEDLTNSMVDQDVPPGGLSLPSGRGLPHKLAVMAQLRFSSFLPAGMFVAGLACVLLLAAQSGPAPASAQATQTETQVESTLSRLVSSAQAGKLPAGQDEAIINTFYYEARHRQISVADLRSNPFVFTRIAGVSGASLLGAAPAASQAASDGALEYGQAVLAARGLTLQTILTGSGRSTAMISNNLLTEGQTICGWTVSEIRPREVVLVWKDKTHVLALPSQK